MKAAGLVFVAGQGPFDPATGAVVGTTIQEQTRQCPRNIEAILEAAGSSMEKVVNASFILRHPEDFAGVNEEWVRWFPTDRRRARVPATPSTSTACASPSRSSPRPERTLSGLHGARPSA